MELTVESLYEEVKRLRARVELVEFVESLIIEEEVPAEDEKREKEAFLERMQAGEVKLIPLKEGKRELEIDEKTEEAY